MNKILSLLLLLAVGQHVQAQFYKSVLPSQDFNEALTKIVTDFKYNFKNIASGDKVSQGEYDTYASSVVLPGATDCIINEYRSVKDTTASWQGILYSGDDFAEAQKMYKNTYRLLSKSKIKLVDKTFISFNGRYEEPTDAVRFAVSTLRLNVDDPRYQRFAAELELVTSYNGFQVNVNFFNRKPDDERE